MSRAGNKSFDRCDVKSVETVDYVFDAPTRVTNFGNIIEPTAGFGVMHRHRLGTGDRGLNQYAGSGATLHCPMTDGERTPINSESSSHNGQLVAQNSLRALAGELICRTCRFSAMDPVDVSVERARLANAEAERLQAFAQVEIARRELLKLYPVDPPLSIES